MRLLARIRWEEIAVEMTKPNYCLKCLESVIAWGVRVGLAPDLGGTFENATGDLVGPG